MLRPHFTNEELSVVSQAVVFVDDQPFLEKTFLLKRQIKALRQKGIPDPDFERPELGAILIATALLSASPGNSVPQQTFDSIFEKIFAALS